MGQPIRIAFVYFDAGRGPSQCYAGAVRSRGAPAASLDSDAWRGAVGDGGVKSPVRFYTLFDCPPFRRDTNLAPNKRTKPSCQTPTHSTPNGYDLQISYVTHGNRLALANAVKPKRPGGP